VRCTGMVECGRAWDEIGKEALKILESLGAKEDTGIGNGLGSGTAMSDLSTDFSGPIPRPLSDLSSFTPSQSTIHAEDAVLNAYAQVFHSHLLNSAVFVALVVGNVGIITRIDSNAHLPVRPLRRCQ
jgi:hypothetical protein